MRINSTHNNILYIDKHSAEYIYYEIRKDNFMTNRRATGCDFNLHALEIPEIDSYEYLTTGRIVVGCFELKNGKWRSL
jgi:hypothetical protein